MSTGANIAAGIQFATALQGADLIRTQATIQRDVNELNAKYREIDAWQAEADGFSEVARYSAQLAQIEGQRAAIYAAKNIDTTVGTLGALNEESRLTGFLNTLDMTNQARLLGQNIRREARGIRMNGQANYAQGMIQASGVVAQGAANAISTAASGYGK